MGELSLFPVDGIPVETPVRISRDQRRTLQQQRSLADRIHPATGRPLLHPGWGFTCRDCHHCLATGRNLRTYWKCELHRQGLTRGSATDIRVGWPACDRLLIDPEDPI